MPPSRSGDSPNAVPGNRRPVGMGNRARMLELRSIGAGATAPSLRRPVPAAPDLGPEWTTPRRNSLLAAAPRAEALVEVHSGVGVGKPDLPGFVRELNAERDHRQRATGSAGWWGSGCESRTASTGSASATKASTAPAHQCNFPSGWTFRSIHRLHEHHVLSGASVSRPPLCRFARALSARRQ